MKRSVVLVLAMLMVVSLIAMGCSESTPETTAGTVPTDSEVTTQTSAPTTGEAEVLKIGIVEAETGWWAPALGIVTLQVCDAYVDWFNDKGGLTVNGQNYKVELVKGDTKSTFDGVAAAANKLIYEDEVKFIVGPTGFYTPAASAITNPAEVVLFPGWITNTPGEVDATTPYGFTSTYGNIPATIAAIKYMRQTYPDVEKVAVIGIDDGVTPYVDPIIEKYFAEEGFTRVGGKIEYSNEQEDFSPIVSKIREVKDAEALLFDRGAVPMSAALMKGLRSSGCELPCVQTVAVTLDDVGAIAGDSAEGLSTGHVVRGDPELTPDMAEIIARYDADYGATSSLATQNLVSLDIVLRVIAEAQSLEPMAFKEHFEQMEIVDTLCGPGKICGEQTIGIKHLVSHPWSIARYENGKVVPGGWIDPGIIP